MRVRNTGGVRIYGQYCPIARGAEIFAERWTPLIIRNLYLGCGNFSEILEGAPGLSRTLLSQRLQQLERLGVDARICTGPRHLAQRWSLAVWRHPVQVDGIAYGCKHDPPRVAVAVFDRCADAIRAESLGPLVLPEHKGYSERFWIRTSSRWLSNREVETRRSTCISHEHTSVYTFECGHWRLTRLSPHEGGDDRCADSCWRRTGGSSRWWAC